MKTIHYTHKYLIDPRHQVSISVIGIGGTGSRLLTELVAINTILLKLGYPGIHVIAADADKVSESNIGRGDFYYKEDISKNKAHVMIERINFNCNFKWAYYPGFIDQKNDPQMLLSNNIVVSCIDKVAPRISMLKGVKKNFVRPNEFNNRYEEDKWPFYFIDCGNSFTTGQVILGTAGKIVQPKGMADTCKATLPNFVDVFTNAELKKAEKSEDKQASCSTFEAIGRQHPFINKEIALIAAEMIYELLRVHWITKHAAFIDMENRDYKYRNV